MRVTLKEFQAVAADRVHAQLKAARRDARDLAQDQAVILAAPTGSGKTLITTAVIERLFFGSEAVPPDPNAAVLWITDQPELNEQTRRKMLATSSQIGPERLVVIDSSFDDGVLPTGKVCFLNTQKIGANALLVKRSDERDHTFWEIVDNSNRSPDINLYVIIDEAHRGMSESAAERQRATSLMQRFIKGNHDMGPSPVVLGISATPQRFYDLLSGTARITRPVVVTPEEVRESGLIKERVVVFHPQETAPSDITLLRQATKDLGAITTQWREYCESQGEELVQPLLIVQVEDGTADVVSKTNLAEAIAAIKAEIGTVPDEAFAHAFQEKAPIRVGTTDVRYIAPPDVSEDPDVRVVLFKTSLNTGWDCPQAEVMMSFRRAVDYTNIAQLVGRMVRAPLARRVDEDERLNAVSLFLPHYDEAALERVVEYLTESGESAGAIEIETKPPVLLARADGSDQAFEALGKIPSYQLPRKRKVNDARRLVRLARNLSRDQIDADANEREVGALVARLLDENARLADDAAYADVIAERGTLTVRRVDWSLGDGETDEETIEVEVSAENVLDLFAAAGRRVGEGLHEAYWRTRVTGDPSVVRKARLELVALVARQDVYDGLMGAARTRVRELFDTHAVAIAALPERRRQVYDDVRGLSAVPELSPIVYPEEIVVPQADTRWERHLFIAPDGLAPFRLNGWEQRVLAEELEREDVIGWVRNLDRKKWALLVPYESGGEAKPLFPDFLVIRRSENQTFVDILDPHDPNLSDAPDKARGLAKFAQLHGPEFGRIELIAEIGGNLRRLDLKNEDVRARVLAATTSAHLRAVFA